MAEHEMTKEEEREAVSRAACILMDAGISEDDFYFTEEPLVTPIVEGEDITGCWVSVDIYVPAPQGGR
jgi:hypothetical protein